MTGHEIIKEMWYGRSKDRCIVKWWRKENDFVDYELVDTFLANLNPDHDFAGFELITMGEMWQELHRLVPERVMLEKHHGETMIRWQHMIEGDGTMRDDLLPYNAPSLLAVFEGETHGDTLC